MRKIAIILATLMVLSGCSSKFAYNNLDWLIYWYVDDYIELTDQQEQVFDGKLQQWIRWHRTEELTQYVQHLNTVKQQALGEPLSPEQIASQFDSARNHWERLRDRLSPELASMATSLSDDQVVYLFAALEKENQENEEEREELSDEERQERRIEDITEQVEEMIGRVTDDQEQIIESYSPKFQSTYDYWLSYRREIQQKARELFATRDSNPAFVEQLTDLMLNPQAFRTERHQQIIEQNRLLYATMIAEIHSTLTDKQKRKLSKEISAIIDDLEDLMGD